MHRYYFGWIEEPFPWLLLGGAVVVGLVVPAVVAFGVLAFFDCDILDS